MNDARYDYPFNPDPVVSPYGWAVQQVQPGSSVLDLGCGAGVVSGHLAREHGCRVCCVDLERHPSLAVDPDAFVALDLERDEERLAALVREREPEVVLLLDVLEHLREPARLLELLARALGPRARLLISLPNVASASMVLRLLSDDFSYQEAGLLDRDHLRHFTRRTARELLAGAGFGVLQVHRTRIPLEAQEWRAPFAARDAEALARLAQGTSSGADAYQLCLEASLEAPAGPEEQVDGRLSVVVRTHDPARLPLLEEALFSLAIQEHDELEVLVAAQNPTPAHLRRIEEALEGQPWRPEALRRVLSLELPPGEDGRSRLLNLGIEAASGRYLAFLDDDDRVYHHGYATLIAELRASGKALAAGGCRAATLEPGRGYATSKGQPFVRDLPPSPAVARMLLFAANFVPIHSYVIDRARVGAFPLRFAEDWDRLEDHEFLLRFCAVFEPSFACLDQALSEYRFEEARPHEFFHTGNRSRGREDHARCVAAEERLAARREELVALLPVSAVAELTGLLVETRAVRRGLPFRVARKLSTRLERHPSLREWILRVGRRLRPGD